MYGCAYGPGAGSVADSQHCLMGKVSIVLCKLQLGWSTSIGGGTIQKQVYGAGGQCGCK